MNNSFNYDPQNDGQPSVDFGMMPSQPPKSKGNAYAVAALVLGIISVAFTCCCCCLYYLSLVLSIVAIVMAVLAKHANGGTMPGKATAGLILAIIGILLFVCLIAVEIAFNAGAFDEAFYELTGMTVEEYLESTVGSDIYNDVYGDVSPQQ